MSRAAKRKKKERKNKPEQKQNLDSNVVILHNILKKCDKIPNAYKKTKQDENWYKKIGFDELKSNHDVRGSVCTELFSNTLQDSEPEGKGR